MDKSKVENNLRYLRTTPEQIVKIFTGYHKQLEKDRQMHRIFLGANPAEIRDATARQSEAMQKTKANVLTDLEKEREILKTRVHGIDTDIAPALGYRLDSKDTNENLLRENRMSAAWTRLKPVLDGRDEYQLPEKVSELVKSFGASADDDSIAVLRRELPLYVEGRFSGKEAIVPEVMDAFDVALAGANAEAQEALSIKRELETGSCQLRMAIDYCEYAIKNEELSFPMPEWEAGKTAIVGINGVESGGKSPFQL